jgi:hypothetical protein
MRQSKSFFDSRSIGTSRSIWFRRDVTFRLETVTLFGQALQHGTKYIYQAMPRMLTIWLDTGDQPTLLDILKSRKKKCAPSRLLAFSVR